MNAVFDNDRGCGCGVGLWEVGNELLVSWEQLGPGLDLVRPQRSVHPASGPGPLHRGSTQPCPGPDPQTSLCGPVQTQGHKGQDRPLDSLSKLLVLLTRDLECFQVLRYIGVSYTTYIPLQVGNDRGMATRAGMSQGSLRVGVRVSKFGPLLNPYPSGR